MNSLQEQLQAKKLSKKKTTVIQAKWTLLGCVITDIGKKYVMRILW